MLRSIRMVALTLSLLVSSVAIAAPWKTNRALAMKTTYFFKGVARDTAFPGVKTSFQSKVVGTRNGVALVKTIMTMRYGKAVTKEAKMTFVDRRTGHPALFPVSESVFHSMRKR